MKKLFIGAALAALGTTGASAQGDLKSEGELRALIAQSELLGYRVLDDSCLIACDAAVGDTNAIEESIAGHAAMSGGDADPVTSPRTSPFADAVAYRGGRRGLKRFRTADQVVYLKFVNTTNPTFTVDVVDFETRQFLGTITLDDYEFDQAERAMIRDRIAADYEEFDIRITTTEPTSGEYATIDFTDNDRLPGQSNFVVFLTDSGGAFVSGLFGRADEIDFGNDNYGGGAFADPNYYNVINALFDSSFFTILTGLPNTEENFRMAQVNTASQIGGHEIGHSVGLRHHDSFGAPDDGLPPFGPPREEFVPIYEGPAQATETVLHLMATPAFGLPLQEFIATTNGFFSERSALKLESAEDARVYLEGDLKVARRMGGAKTLDLKIDMIPNTVLEGENAGGSKIKMETAWVQGRIEDKNDVDEYVFTADAGSYVNAELISFSDALIDDDFIGTLRLFKVNDDGSRDLVGENAQTFEPYDPFLLDIQVPSFGQYVLEVAAQPVAFIPQADGTFFPVPLDTDLNRSLLSGDYDLLVYQVDRALGARPTRGRR